MSLPAATEPSTAVPRSIVDALPEAVLALDAQSSICLSNPAAERLLGLSAEQLATRPAFDPRWRVVREDGSPFPAAEFPSSVTLRTGAPAEATMGVHRPDGTVTWLSTRATALDPALADGAAVLLVLSDVTERLAVERELRELAEQDPLTGLLNRRAFTAALECHLRDRRAYARGGALLLLDLDDFKRVNDTMGHATGDRLLIDISRALARRVRAEDLLARLGGDEFALLLLGAGEEDARAVAGELCSIVRRQIVAGPTGATCRVTASVGMVPLAGAGARAGARALMNADAAMYAAKAAGRDRCHVHGRGGVEHAPPAGVDDLAARLSRRTRQLGLANALGARLAGMTDVEAIAEATVEELHQAFGYYLCAVVRLREDDNVEAVAVRGDEFLALDVRGWSQPRDAGLIGECLRRQAPVLVGDVGAHPAYNGTPETSAVQAEMVVPLNVDGRPWGVLNVEEVHAEAFDEDDLELLGTVGDQVGAALRSACLFERLERAYLGTAEALAAAMEAKDAYTGRHSHTIADHAEALGRRLGLDPGELRDLRLAAVLHDIGKIAVPEAILNKAGPLTPGERRIMERHTIVGEQILAPVELLARVRRTVRHGHERWDGAGYPDGLAGDAIPLGSRIIFACDALDAMTSDRPYRRALPAATAYEELKRNAGSQFDPSVIAALLELVA